MKGSFEEAVQSLTAEEIEELVQKAQARREQMFGTVKKPPQLGEVNEIIMQLCNPLAEFTVQPQQIR